MSCTYIQKLKTKLFSNKEIPFYTGFLISKIIPIAVLE